MVSRHRALRERPPDITFWYDASTEADMTYLAIVHAPALRPGARLCISDLAQTAEHPPAPIAPGAEIDLRFGTCCPDLLRGAITLCDTQAEQAILRVDAYDWTIRRSHQGGVHTPGMVADDWFVVGQ